MFHEVQRRGKSLPTLVENTVRFLCICYSVFDIDVESQCGSTERQHDLVLHTKWDMAMSHFPTVLVAIREQCTKSPGGRLSRRGGDVKFCTELKRTLFRNPPRCPWEFPEIFKKDCKPRNWGSYKSLCVQRREISLATVIFNHWLLHFLPLRLPRKPRSLLCCNLG